MVGNISFQVRFYASLLFTSPVIICRYDDSLDVQLNSSSQSRIIVSSTFAFLIEEYGRSRAFGINRDCNGRRREFGVNRYCGGESGTVMVFSLDGFVYVQNDLKREPGKNLSIVTIITSMLIL